MPTVDELLAIHERRIAALERDVHLEDIVTRTLQAVHDLTALVEKNAKQTANDIHLLDIRIGTLHAEMRKGFQDVLAAIQALK